VNRIPATEAITLFRFIDVICDYIAFCLRAHSRDLDVFIIWHTVLVRIPGDRPWENKCPDIYIYVGGHGEPDRCPDVPFWSWCIKRTKESYRNHQV